MTLRPPCEWSIVGGHARRRWSGHPKLREALEELICSTPLLYRLSWTWAWVWLSRPIDATRRHPRANAPAWRQRIRASPRIRAGRSYFVRGWMSHETCSCAACARSPAPGRNARLLCSRVVGRGCIGIHNNYGQFSKFHVCFCGLDPGNLKFETVRTDEQHICFQDLRRSI